MAKDDTAPSDWLKTATPSLTALDSALRCLICKDYLQTPMITSCAHTFCSICIRRHLATEGKCPFCRAHDQPQKLKNNNAMEDVVAAFKRAKPELLKVDETLRQQAAPAAVEGRKRKADQVPVENEPESSPRKTRSAARRGQPLKKTTQQPIELSDSDYDDDEDEHVSEERIGETEQPSAPSDGLVSCPICQGRMPEAAVYLHLDKCDGTPKPQVADRSRPSQPHFAQTPTTTRPPKLEPLGGLNYSMLNDATLRKKLDNLGIPSSGNKPIMSRRHTEWVNLWNANLDSRIPKSKRELLNELDIWERHQSKGSSDTDGIMEKNFDGKAWANEHKSEFADLIASARAKMKAKTQENNEQPGEGSTPMEKPARDDDGGALREDQPLTNSGAEMRVPSVADS